VILKSGIKNTRKMADFPENIGKRLSIDETSLSNGTLYYFNQQSSQRQGAIVAMIAGTKAESNCNY
jgi:hypothetical protein